MDIATRSWDAEDNNFINEEVSRPRRLPPDLPTSLNDRRPVRSYGGETEIYDAWQGRSIYTSNSAQLTGI